MHICWVATDPIAICAVFDAGRNVGVATVGADNIAAEFRLRFDGGNDRAVFANDAAVEGVVYSVCVHGVDLVCGSRVVRMRGPRLLELFDLNKFN